MTKGVVGVAYDGREIREGDILTYSKYGIEYLRTCCSEWFNRRDYWVNALKLVRVCARGGAPTADGYVNCVLLEDPAGWFDTVGDSGCWLWECNFLIHSADEEVTQTRRLTVLRMDPDGKRDTNPNLS